MQLWSPTDHPLITSRGGTAEVRGVRVERRLAGRIHRGEGENRSRGSSSTGPDNPKANRRSDYPLRKTPTVLPFPRKSDDRAGQIMTKTGLLLVGMAVLIAGCGSDRESAAPAPTTQSPTAAKVLTPDARFVHLLEAGGIDVKGDRTRFVRLANGLACSTLGMTIYPANQRFSKAVSMVIAATKEAPATDLRVLGSEASATAFVKASVGIYCSQFAGLVPA